MVNLEELRRASDGRMPPGDTHAVNVVARDALLDARRIWWCVEHLANATEYGECMGASMQRMALHTPFPCKKERSVVVPVEAPNG